MNCGLSKSYMMQYFDGELNDIDNARFKHHLKYCDKCRREFSDMKEVIDFLEEDDVICPPPNFEDDVIDKIRLLEDKRKEKTAGILVLLYNFTTIISIVFIITFIIKLEILRRLNDISMMDGSISLSSAVLMNLYNIIKNTYNFMVNMYNLFYNAGSLIVETYYYYIIILFTIIIIAQRKLSLFAKQNRRGV